MISTLNGIIFEKEPGFAVVECGGVGYEVYMSLVAYNELPPVGEMVRLFVRHIVREDDELLFGFVNRDDRALFDLLRDVSGVGPKSALAILGGISSRELRRAIAAGDAKLLATVKGVGKKTAERIVVDLKGKIDPTEALVSVGGDSKSDAIMQDTVKALMQLGFSQEVALRKVEAAMSRGKMSGSADELLRAALAER